MAINDQLVEEKGTLALLGDQVAGKADAQAIAQLNDQLAAFDRQITDATGALKDTARKLEERGDDRTPPELAEALAVVRERTQQVFWVLCIGVGVIAPAVVALLALTAFRW